MDPTEAIQKALAAKLAAEASSTSAGPAAVDAKLGNHQMYKVFEKDGKSYSGYLNCADLKNNNNKFYVC